MKFAMLKLLTSSARLEYFSQVFIAEVSTAAGLPFSFSRYDTTIREVAPVVFALEGTL
jgi:hypothetical protein